MVNPEPHSEQQEESSWWKLQAVFFAPAALFQAINRNPNWFLPLILTALVSFTSAAIIFSRVDFSRLIRTQLEASGRAQQLSQEQLEETVRQTADSPLVKVFRYVSAVLGPAVIVLIVSGALLIALLLTGSEITYHKVFSVTSHTFFFYTFVLSVLTVPVFLLAADPNSIDLQNPVFTNLGLLVDAREHSILNRLLQAIDVLALYHVYLLGLGLSTVGRNLSRAAATTIVGVAYGLYVGIGLIWRLIVG